MKKRISIFLALLMLAGILAIPAQAVDIKNDNIIGAGDGIINPGGSGIKIDDNGIKIDGQIKVDNNTVAPVTNESSVTGSWCDITVANLSLDAMCYIYFGYNNTAEMQNVDDYGVIFWTAEQEKGGYTYLNAAKTTSSAVICSKADGWANDTNTYFNYGVAMKQMTDLVWGQGYYISGSTVYTSSKVVEYSVQTYAGNKLGILNGGRSKTQNPKLETLLTSLLQTGAAAQEYLDYKTYDLASDMLHWSEGLEYDDYSDGTCSVTGIGTCTDTKLYIPKFSPKGNKVEIISWRAFENNSSITDVVIPTTVSYIWNNAFDGCTALANIRIHDEIEAIDVDAFSGTAFYNTAENWDVNALYLGNYLIAVNDSTLTSFTVKNGTTMIVSSVFEGFAELAEVNIPADLRVIGYNAFADCSKLATVSFAEGSKLDSIEQYAFRGCTSLSNISLPDSLTYIYYDAFENTAYYHEKSNWSGDVLYIGSYLITAEGYAPDGITPNGYSSETLEIKEGTLCLAEGCLGGYIYDDDNTTVKTLSLPSSLRTCDSDIAYTLSTLVALETITIADGNEHFYVEGNCLIDKATGTVLCAANTAVMPAGVKAIGRNAFYCFAGTSIAIPSTVTSIGEEAFYKSAITSITIPGSVTEIAEFAFHYCKDLSRVVLQSGVKIIGLDAFGGDPDSTNGELTIYIPKTVSSIGEYALEDWKMLNIYYEGTKQEWESIEKGELWAAGVGNINLNYEQAIPTE